MKILVLGANGMAGHTISHYFIEKGYETTTFSVTPISFGKNVVGNALDSVFFKSLLLSDDFDTVINCIGLLIKDCDTFHEKAVYLNSYIPHLAVDILKNRKTKFIQMSTDCVFEGNTGPYNENSFPDGRFFYDRTKALGEINDSKNLTFRNSIVGPDINFEGTGLFNWFMKQEKTVKGYKHVLWTGVTTISLAKAMEKAIETDLCGLYNLVNNKSISKFDLLTLFNKHLRNNSIEIVPDSELILDKSLVTERTDFPFKVPDYEEMVSEMKKWIHCHKQIYPHYFKGEIL